MPCLIDLFLFNDLFEATCEATSLLANGQTGLAGSLSPLNPGFTGIIETTEETL
jgi:hypothetical protein